MEDQKADNLDELFTEEVTARRRLKWLWLAPVVVGLAGYAVAYAYTKDRLPAGAMVGPVSVGGLSVESAEAKVERFLAARAPDQLALRAAAEEVVVDVDKLGLGFDVASSVEQVPHGASGNPIEIAQFFFQKHDYQLLTAGSASEVLQPLAKKTDIQAREGAVRFTPQGQFRVIQPRPGRALDLPRAEQEIADALLAGDTQVDLTREVVEPEISATEVQQAVNDFARPATRSAVRVRIANQTISLSPQQFAPALRLQAEDGVLVPGVDVALLKQRTEAAFTAIAVEPVDASMRVVDGEPQIVPGKSGVSFDAKALGEGLIEAATKPNAGRVVRLETVLQTPDFTVAELKELGIKEPVSSFTTYFPYAEYRNVNIGRGAELINGTILRPGETFSLNQTVGERTRENGFTEGYIISNGIFKSDLGGGVSQVATTTFNAAFFAGLEDVEHKPHSFYIDRYPVGREATVAWPTVDLKFKNDTPHGILIQAWRVNSTPSSQGSMNVRLWSTKTWNIRTTESSRYNFTSPATRRLTTPDCESHTGYGGFDIDVFREFYRPGSTELVKREKFHTTYTPSDSVVCVTPPPARTPAASPSPSAPAREN